MQHPPLAIIGAGNMGTALLGGWIAKGYPPGQIWLADPDTDKITRQKNQHGIHITCNNTEAVKAADVIVLAVKPQHLGSVAKEIAPAIRIKHPLILSIAAGIRISTLKNWLGSDARLIRCMPNTPVLIGCGASALFADTNITSAERTYITSLLQTTGLAIWVEKESALDTVTALSGSGPAYFFYIIDALETGAIALGLTPENAHSLAVQTALGASRMAAESTCSVRELQRQVTSPRGTTEAALAIFDKNHLPKLLTEALSAAQKRSIELAESFDAS